ncbi:hypothetical protein PYW07_008296 [Mythimna separata]|uniref:CRAL-TRIO domain-containing protein n=1 Tax=Mythimna separata TaxID=271217 RepID=A0AAD7YCE6_MYTSE|nr:hypothetical protein PYW07_008296 [Mythimna separata]
MESVSENRLLKLPPGALENIRKIHNLDQPGRVEEAVKILEEWILKQDHIIKKDFSKDYLERILISCKGSVEKSKKQIDRLCTMKTLTPKFFEKVNPKEELQDILDLVWVIPLPMITEDYYRIEIIKINNKNFTTESFMKYFQYTVILSEYVVTHDYVNGYIVIDDFTDLNLLELMSKMNHVEMQQFMTILTEGYGARLKGIHILTDSLAVELLIKTMKLFVSEKIGNRIHFQPTLEDLHKAVPKEILPVEYGGNERSIEKLHEEWIEELSSEKQVEYMKMMREACTDETKRHDGMFNEEYMGTPGAFRCLRVD